jgi:hypothetical protein
MFEEYAVLEIEFRDLLYLETDRVKRVVYHCKHYPNDTYYAIVVYTNSLLTSDVQIENLFNSELLDNTNLQNHLQWWNKSLGITKIEVYYDHVGEASRIHDIRILYVDYYKQIYRCSWDYIWMSLSQRGEEYDGQILRSQLRTCLNTEKFRRKLPYYIYEYTLNKNLHTLFNVQRGFKDEIKLILDYLF